VKQTNVLTEGAMAAALFTTLLAISVYIPILGLISVWLLPLPFVVFTIRNGLKPGFVLLGVALMLSLIISGLIGLPLAVMFGSGGLVVGYLSRQKRPAFAILLGGSLVYIFNVIMIFMISVVFLDFNMITDSVHMLQQSMDKAEELMTSFGEDVGDQFDTLQQSIGMIQYMAPALFVLVGVSYALITQLIAAPVLKRLRLGDYVRPWVPFREWRFPKSLLWYYLIALLGFSFGGFEEGTGLYTVFFNLFWMLEIIMVIQGFSFLFYFFYIKKIHKSVPIIIVIAAFFPLTSILVLFIGRILGIIDLGFDLRKWVRS
jgi:uncharacterized protein YybS (DUF2232 family)